MLYAICTHMYVCIYIYIISRPFIYIYIHIIRSEHLTFLMLLYYLENKLFICFTFSRNDLRITHHLNILTS